MSMDAYEIIRSVGRGSFGIAWLCEQKCDRQSVVVKQVSIQDMDTEEQQAAQNEVRVLERMNHPNVIEFYRSFLDVGALNIVMEFAAGGNLHQYLKAKNNVFGKYEEIMSMFCQMLLGLEHIHSRKILHRDFKSKNVLLTGDREPVVKISDFGISKILESKSKASTQLGTQCYWSPELCAGRPYDQGSDIWALGCVLYEMLTLKKPFEAQNPIAMALKVMQGEYAPVNTYIYPERTLPGLLGAMIRVNPERRYTIPMIKAHPSVFTHLARLYVNVGRIH